MRNIFVFVAAMAAIVAFAQPYKDGKLYPDWQAACPFVDADGFYHSSPDIAKMEQVGFLDVAVTNVAVVTTNAAPVQVCAEAQQISAIVTNFPDILAQTGDNVPAFIAYAKSHAATFTADGRDRMLTTMNELLPDVIPYCTGVGLGSFQAQTIVTNFVTAPADSNLWKSSGAEVPRDGK